MLQAVAMLPESRRGRYREPFSDGHAAPDERRYREPPSDGHAAPDERRYREPPSDGHAVPDERRYREPFSDGHAAPDERRYRGQHGYEYAEPDDHRHRGQPGYRYAEPEGHLYWRQAGSQYAEPEQHRYRGPTGNGRGEYGHRPPAASGYWDDEDDGYPRRADAATGGADGNERLTGLTGLALLVLFAAEGLTILAVRQMLTLHFFIGMLLIGPVLLKVCSTGYRFVRYYTGDAEYRRKGPPALLLRLLGPLVILTSLAVIGTGVMLALTGPGPGIWLLAHKAAFVLWFGVMTIHVLAYVWRLPRLVGSDLASRARPRAEEVLGGRTARWLLLTASLLSGLLLAVLTVHLAGPWAAAGGVSR